MSGEKKSQSVSEKLTPKKHGIYGPPSKDSPQKALTTYIKKRSGELEPVMFNKILWRIQQMSTELNVTPAILAQSVITDLYDGIESSKIDEITAEKAHHWCTKHPDYDVLASRIAISNHHKETVDDFSQVMWELHEIKLIDDEIYKVVEDNAALINETIQYDRDYHFSYLGFKKFEYSYSTRKDERIFERPQHMFMRVALGIHGSDLEAAFETYNWMSCKYFIHATPTLFNAGTPIPQMSSCFLVAMKEEKQRPYDSIDKIYQTLHECANISKTAGGIGIHVSNVRCKGSLIRSAGRGSSGIVPMLKNFNETARYVDQGRRRKGAFAIYLEPWHADVYDFLDLKKPDTARDLSARDLHYAMWVSDLFMERVKNDEMWSLMCPDDCPELCKTWGEEFNKHYLRYESEGTFVRQVKAQDLFKRIIETQILTGEPYMLFKDACNRKSNQQNLGTIRSSNLCVHPETRILTRHSGWQQIQTLKDQEVEIWNGFEWSTVTVRQTGTNQKLVNVELSDGTNLKCTRYHKFYLNQKYTESKITNLEAFNDKSMTKCVEASQLQKGDKLIKFDMPDNKPVDLFIRVTSVTDIEGTHDTYCFTEPIRGTGMFEGVVTGQCAEIIEYSDNEETGTCNLASLGLPAFVEVDQDTQQNFFNFKKLYRVTKIATRNLNKVIDKNFYPTKEARTSNMRHRPIGIGVQGLADVFIALRMPFDSPEAKELNKRIFETMYYAALRASCKLARQQGVYSSYKGSPASKGILQYDMCGLTEDDLSGLWDWRELKGRIAKYGLRNSLLIALMPTASTSQLFGYNECFEPYTNNIYTSKILGGTFKIINRQLIMDLIDLGLWSKSMKQRIIADSGSVQQIPEIPENLKALYKTGWEIKKRVIIDMAADRGAFVCQSQSMNLFIAKPTVKMMSNIHVYAWQKGLKTGQYYLRSKPAVDPIKATVGVALTSEQSATNATHTVCPMDQSEEDDADDCMMCGS